MKKFLIVPVLALLAFSVTAMAANDAADDTKPVWKVYLCHFDGHEAGEVFNTSHDLDGDYIIFPGNDDSYCVEHGGNGIWVSNVAADKGHRAQLLMRMCYYDGAADPCPYE